MDRVQLKRMSAAGAPAIQPSSESNSSNPPHDFRFWSIIFALCTTGVLSALEGTVVSTALPTIVRDLGGGSNYLWAANSYFITTTVFLPLYGQTANIFGRRYLLIFSVAVFALGSGISGGASSMGMLIAGRAIQGVGGGGITMLSQLIISDIVPLRERGTYMAIIFAAMTVGNGMGPFVGGIIVEKGSWRWIFYLNLPIAGFAMVLLVAFLHVNYKKEPVMQKLKRIDYGGNVIFIGSVVAILIALSYAGVVHPWGSWRTLVPLLLGFMGLALFFIYEGYPTEPTMPFRLFKNRTTAVALTLTFIHSLLALWVIYFLPVYFQGALSSSPARSGVQLLPTVLVLIPFAAIGGKVLGIFGRYRPLHHLGFALAMIGLGCFTLLRSSSPMAVWIIVQMVAAAGIGIMVGVLLPAVQVALPESDVAVATATFAFLRSFGIIWAVTLPATIFNNEFDRLARTRITDEKIRAVLSGGRAYEHATKIFIDSLQGLTRAQVVGVYADSLKLIWQVALGVAALGFLVTFCEEELEMRTKLNTNFGVAEKEKKKNKGDDEENPVS
ncbi:MAG: hypothetical protein M1839_001711 [Geoglossum umbratile]|nr:MAG: hypothetical protein M1839_001711 [Geoglossum umbratile]